MIIAIVLIIAIVVIVFIVVKASKGRTTIKASEKEKTIKYLNDINKKRVEAQLNKTEEIIAAMVEEGIIEENNLHLYSTYCYWISYASYYRDIFKSGALVIPFDEAVAQDKAHGKRINEVYKHICNMHFIDTQVEFIGEPIFMELFNETLEFSKKSLNNTLYGPGVDAIDYRTMYQTSL